MSKRYGVPTKPKHQRRGVPTKPTHEDLGEGAAAVTASKVTQRQGRNRLAGEEARRYLPK